MRFLSGIITGVLLIVLVVFFLDTFDRADAPAEAVSQKIVNWDVAMTKLQRSLGLIQKEVREEVHDATR